MAGSDDLDPLLELFRKQADRDLRRRRSLDNRIDRATKRKAERAGYAGDLCEALTIPRRHWPRVHELCICDGVPITTTLLTPDDPGHQLVIRTSATGALRLRAEIERRP